jgi:hypothetical protein
MAKKSMKDAAAAGTSVFDQIANGNVQNVENAQDVQNTQDTKAVKHAPRMERLNLKIPADIKEYLQAAAYRESSPKKTVSLTEYLCNLVRADMEKHKDD